MLLLPRPYPLNLFKAISLGLAAADCRYQSSGRQQQRTTTAVPEQWKQGFWNTPPVPEQLAGTATAFSWLKRQQPDVPLALLGKLFRQRQVRLLQQGHIKRVNRTRSLQPGDVLLVPKELPPSAVGAAAADASSSSSDDEEEELVAWQQRRQQRWPQERARLTANEPSKDAQQHQRQQLLLPRAAALALDPVPQPRRQWQQQGQGEQHSEEWQQEEQIDPWADIGFDPWAPRQLQQTHQQHAAGMQQQHCDRHQQHQKQQQQQQPPRLLKALTVPTVHKWLLASSADIAVLYKPPGVSLTVSSSDSSSSSSSNSSSSRHKVLSPVLAEALRVRPPEEPQIVCGLDDDRASGAVVLSRHSAAQQWLSAWVAGEPAAVAAATVALQSERSSAAAGSILMRGKRFVHQQRKLEKLAAAAAGTAPGGAAAAAGYSAKELAGLQQLLAAVGGLRLRRVFWAVVQGQLPVRQTGTMKNRLLHGGLALQAMTRYKVLASSAGLSWLELQPLTNHKNQMRLQCKMLGTPIVGDYKYGYRPWALLPPSAQTHLARHQAGSTPTLQAADDDSSQSSESWQDSKDPLMLHCREVVLLRPRKPPIRVVAPLPREFKSVLTSLDWK